jgi:hypothetical protein
MHGVNTHRTRDILPAHNNICAQAAHSLLSHATKRNNINLVQLNNGNGTKLQKDVNAIAFAYANAEEQYLKI